MNQGTTDLLQEIEEHNFESELYDLLAGTFFDKIRVQELSDLVYKHAQKMPFDMVLDFWETLRYPVEDIERSCNVPGFNDWYKKIHGKPVGEVS